MSVGVVLYVSNYRNGVDQWSYIANTCVNKKENDILTDTTNTILSAHSQSALKLEKIAKKMCKIGCTIISKAKINGFWNFSSLCYFETTLFKKIKKSLILALNDFPRFHFSEF